MENLPWQIFVWVIDNAVIVPISAAVSYWVYAVVQKSDAKMLALAEGDWKSSFMLNLNGDWIDQDVKAKRIRFGKKVKIWSEGGREKFGWTGYLGVHQSVLVGAWENTTNPQVAGAQSLNVRFLNYENFVVGATTGAHEKIAQAIRVSTWVMARSDEELELAKQAVTSEISS